MLLSHLHADHCLDLTGLYVSLRYTPDEPGVAVRATPVPVHGPVGTGDRHRARRTASSPTELRGPCSTFHDVTPGTFALGPFQVTAAPASTRWSAHGCGCRAGGRTLVYTGDTGPCPALDPIAAGADLLLAEASFTARRDRTRRTCT